MSLTADRPRLRDSSSWWIDHTNGTVTLVVSRRVPDSEGRRLELRYPAPTEAAAERAYAIACAERHEDAKRQAGKRAGYGAAPSGPVVL